MPNHTRNILLILTLAALVFISACTLASPFNQIEIAVAEQPTETVVKTLQPTFTATTEVTATPTKTTTPTNTPIPTDTSTPIPPTATKTPLPTKTALPTSTKTATPPPPPTDTPAPTNVPTPTWVYQLAELYEQPTKANILSIMVAFQAHDGGWLPGLRLVGTDPDGVVTKSEFSVSKVVGYTPPSEVIKSGNTKFEPFGGYVTGVWSFHVESSNGTQRSATFQIIMDVNNKKWYFIRIQPL